MPVTTASVTNLNHAQVIAYATQSAIKTTASSKSSHTSFVMTNVHVSSNGYVNGGSSGNSRNSPTSPNTGVSHLSIQENGQNNKSTVNSTQTIGNSAGSRLNSTNLLLQEKAIHMHYLKDFRCDQCPLFLQHKCTQHKPFTCFHWHFANQRRRRPLRKRDGTFNYSPDMYCNKYDETTGICPDGDECPNLHRTAGDTERRYHLRYYKTGKCVYETDNRGFCVKNGPHCAFAHGQHDLRMPVYDVREQAQMAEGESGDGMINGHGHYDKDRNAVNEDPRWQDISFVLANYKTELCKRPPRLCRQGYACPQYHNNKDRRRSPKKFKYRSTPCPSVKQGDEWGDPTNCENEDSCTYCHTRTEQQFHPEIYKSTKCNDIQQNNYCPRGPFCAFAHSENADEINAAREFATDPTTDVPPSLATKSQTTVQHTNSSPVEMARANSISAYSRAHVNTLPTIPSSLPDHFDHFSNFDLSTPQPTLNMAQLEMNNSPSGHNNLGPIARPRSFSTSNTKAVQPLPLSALLEKNKLLNSSQPVPVTNPLGSTLFSAASSSSQLFAPLQEPHPPPNSFVSSMPSYSLTQENVAMDSILNPMDDLNIDNLSAKLSSLNASNSNMPTAGMDTQLGVDMSNDSIRPILRRSSLLNESAPINIPAANRMGPSLSDNRSNSATGFNISPPSNLDRVGPIGPGSPMNSSFGLSSNFSSGRTLNTGSTAQSASGSHFLDTINLLSQTLVNQNTTVPPSLASASASLATTMVLEMQRLRDENAQQKSVLQNYEERVTQIIQTLQMQINEATKKEQLAEKARDEAIEMLNSTQKELELLRTNFCESNSFQRHMNDNNNFNLNFNIGSLSRSQLIQLQHKIQRDLNCVEEALQRKM